jgi:hypothetical protein
MNLKNIYNKCFKLEYLYTFFLIIIFFVYGLSLSEFIDYVFPDHNDNIPEHRLILEIIGEIGVTYLIYYTLQKSINTVINQLYNSFKNRPPYLDQMLLIAFSIGIYKHLQKSTTKIHFFKDKCMKYIKFPS